MIAGRSLNFRERTVLDTARQMVAADKPAAEVYDSVRQTYDAVAAIIGDTIAGEFWDYLKQELGIDPELSCCPVCAGVSAPANHLHCMHQLGEWPAMLRLAERRGIPSLQPPTDWQPRNPQRTSSESKCIAPGSVT